MRKSLALPYMKYGATIDPPPAPTCTDCIAGAAPFTIRRSPVVLPRLVAVDPLTTSVPSPTRLNVVVLVWVASLPTVKVRAVLVPLFRLTIAPGP